ncbi:hypothetical protein ANTRET_LOCUS2217 [Anthophora retusa]
MRVVYELTNELRGRNVCCDNFFTLFNLRQLLLKRKMTMLGIIRKNKSEPSKEMINKQVYYFILRRIQS